MGFVNQTFTLVLAPGFKSSPGWETVIQRTASKHETRLQGMAQSLASGSIFLDKRNNADMATARHFLEARRGAAYAFPLTDLLDFTTAADLVGAVAETNVVLETIDGGTADGTATQFQLRKIYEPAGLMPYAKKITLPISGTVVIAKDGTPFATGGNWTVSTTTGVVTFSVAPANGVVVTAGFQHYKPMRFTEQTERAAEFQREFWDANSVRLDVQEVPDETEWPDIVPTGGFSMVTMTADMQLDPSQSDSWELDVVKSASLNVYMPPPGPLPGGIIFHKIIVAGSSGDLTLLDHEGTTIEAALAVGDVRTVLLWNDGTNSTWRSVA